MGFDVSRRAIRKSAPQDADTRVKVMTRCPECRRDYHDDRLLYSLDDGVALVQGPVGLDEAATAVTRKPDTGASGVQPSSGRSRNDDPTAIFAIGPPEGGTPNAPVNV